MTAFSKKVCLTMLASVLLLGGLAGAWHASAQTASPQPAVTPTPTPTPDEEVIKVDTEVVNVLFTAQDRNRRLLTDLRQADVQLMEDGKAQEIVTFSRQVDLPLS